MAGHANKEFNEAVVALSGSFDVYVHDGEIGQSFTLNKPDACLYIPPMVWRKFGNFSTNSVVFVVSDKPNDEENRIADFAEFKLIKLNGTTF